MIIDSGVHLFNYSDLFVFLSKIHSTRSEKIKMINCVDIISAELLVLLSVLQLVYHVDSLVHVTPPQIDQIYSIFCSTLSHLKLNISHCEFNYQNIKCFIYSWKCFIFIFYKHISSMSYSVQRHTYSIILGSFLLSWLYS